MKPEQERTKTIIKINKLIREAMVLANVIGYPELREQLAACLVGHQGSRRCVPLPRLRRGLRYAADGAEKF